MKICFFPHYSFSNRDGATLSMYNIIDELLGRGIEVVVVLPNKNHLEERLKDSRIDFVYMPMFSMRMTIDKLTPASRIKFGMKYIYNQSCVRKTAKILKKKKVDCIHINGLDSSVGAKVAKKLNIPYVWHIRAFIEEDLGKKLCRQKETYRLAAQSDAVIGISEDIRKKFEKVFARPVRVIYNGIPREKYDIADHRILENKETGLLLAGRISLQKGQMTAIRAVELLKKENKYPCRLTLVGQGETKEYLQEVKNYIAEHGLSDVVTVMDHTDDLLGLRGSHDIGLTCSQREAFGRVTVENMMAGMLVIGADSGGTPEIIRDGIDGFLYKPEDEKSLAKMIRKAAADKEKARRLAENGHRRSIEKFSIERVADEVTALYKEVISRKKGPDPAAEGK